ncbi:MAG: hypothetical protein EZS26_001834 [Candidatus Ordinivivax streblomastigis]|uniref:Methyltransferase FkbM domain-containing protein n=1 Tax=Candidatus Ordinivivax streblomastigis TaxID=2540710 RepID=A0A5M8P0V1_9BACT|nr:MAG: hypothetical protein EZS26_001834 [Candidatus Ordinivivax streblomastigis]
MVKKVVKEIRKFWWFGFWQKGEYILDNLHQQRCQRNDDDYEVKRKVENPIYLDRFGYKVYSQNDEDGIIEEIFNRIGHTNKKFVEIGVQNGLESNGHFLLHKGWQGLWIDGDKKMVAELRSLFKGPIEKEQLVALNSFIALDNINQVVGVDGNYNGEIDLLSIDIDGNDYWIWNEIKCIDPRVVVIEYNAKFPPTHEWVMEYDAKHIWQLDDEHGASLKSLELLGEKLGYQLVGTNVRGVNAFFVKKELCKDLFPQPATAENLYNPARWNLQYISGHPSKKYIGK